ncbi:uncharacterized protein MEPE_01623 [Melanopsichium pennsylvanicum]|uniref:Uncharacterized protein n=1 Tax=Melanopsichium pennsylvanicum TaxID=63383 RepID=A0AAJ4XJ10_9BASI|nr:uncharacterized protein MEPE_01623 [Melanopsichium pennsylvanicum]
MPKNALTKTTTPFAILSLALCSRDVESGTVSMLDLIVHSSSLEFYDKPVKGSAKYAMSAAALTRFF